MFATVSLASGCINDGAWVAAPSPVTPVQALDTRMADVSCVSDDWCLAVGNMGYYPLAQVWDGSSWSVIAAPPFDPDGGTTMRSVACGTPTSCVAQAFSVPSSDIYEASFAWDGEAWHLLTDGSEGGGIVTLPYACAPHGSCLVVDNGWGRTVAWNGTSATELPYPGEDVTAIDCFSASNCLATASSSTYSWNGSAWSYLDGADLYEIFRNGPRSFDCVAPDNCLAAGVNVWENGTTSATWDGSVWTEVPLPGAFTSTGVLECVGANQCLLQTATGATVGMLAWMGDWYSAPSPPAGTAGVSSTPAGSAGMSCRPLRCLAVGSTGSPATPTAHTYEWTNS